MGPRPGARLIRLIPGVIVKEEWGVAHENMMNTYSRPRKANWQKIETVATLPGDLRLIPIAEAL
jgi:hypothetical protein